MKIVLGFDDIKKLIEDSYDGVNSVTGVKDIEIKLDVDGDTFKRRKGSEHKKIDQNNSVDYDKLLEERKAQMRTEITGEPIPGKVKSVEERNEEAVRKGLMTTGRGSERPLRKF